MSGWSSLPFEVRDIILKFLTHHENTAPYATVSKEWQSVIEKKNFGRLKLHQSCLDSLEQIAKQQQGLVKHIWLNIELKTYTCRSCRKMESPTSIYANHKIMTEAITRLFFILASWKQNRGGLTLELNAYSPSDSEHWFRGCYSGAPGEDGLDTLESECPLQSGLLATAMHHPNHRFWHGTPTDDALRRPFEPVTLKFQEELPSVQAVTKFLLRRQCRRQLDPSTLSYVWAKLPQLREVIYEPWQLSERVSQDEWDSGYENIICYRLSKSVKTIKIFEDFNETYLEIFQHSQGIHSHLNPDRVRITYPGTGAAFAKKSQQLEDFSVAFLTDACHFFDACQLHWQWPHLRSLALTSRLMDKNNPLSIRRILESAAQCALRMPKLETMTLWNGAKGEACAFTWCREDASISWRGTWDFKLHPSVIKDWKKVAYKYARHEFTVNEELLTQEIRSHGDAIQHLGLHSVVDEVSLRQIRRENNRG